MATDVDCSGNQLGLSNEETNDWVDYNSVMHTCIIILKPLTSAQPSYVRLVLFFIINIVLSQNLKRGLKIRIPLITIDLHLPQE